MNSNCPGRLHPAMYKDGKVLSMEKLSLVLEKSELHIRYLQRKLDEKKEEYERKEKETIELKERLDQLKSVRLLKKTQKFKDTAEQTQTKRAGLRVEKPSEQEDLRQYNKSEKTRDLIIQAFRAKKFLNTLSDPLLNSLIDCMDSKVFRCDEYLMTEGEMGDCVYVLESGKCMIKKNDGSVTNKVIEPGALIGELAIMYNSPRSASIQAISRVAVWFLTRKVYQTFMRKQWENSRKINEDFLLRTELFKNFPREKLIKIVDALQEVIFGDKDLIVREGDVGHTFYVIKSGKVLVTKAQADGTFESLAILKEGQTFGEKAIMGNEIRTATVTSYGPSQCLLLNREIFTFLVGELHDMNAEDLILQEKDKTKLDFEIKSQSISPFPTYSIDDMEIVKTLGSGTFAKVLMVRSKTDGKEFALKSMSKYHIVKYKQQEHVINEKSILNQCHYSLICSLFQTFRDDKCVYLLMKLYQKPDLFQIHRNMKTFSHTSTKFVTGCILSALNYLHERQFIYRDLKLENLMLDEKDYVCLVDFGFAKYLPAGQKTFTFCGTAEYLAPEIFLYKGHDKTVDFWALGILIYEMLAGSTPFVDASEERIFTEIIQGIDNVCFPSGFEPEVCHLIKSLCRADSTIRLGNGAMGIREIYDHSWFSKFDWKALENKLMNAPIFTYKTVEDVAMDVEEVEEAPLAEVDLEWEKEF